MRITMESIRVKSIVLGLFAIACVPLLARADMVIRDNGSGAGDLTLDGGDWSAVVRKQPAELLLTSGGETVRIVPFTGAGVEPEAIVSCETVNTGTADQGEVRATFSAQGKNFEARFHLTSRGALRITPGEGMGGVYVRGPIAVGILPGIRLEDVLYLPDKYPNLDEVHVPGEDWFAALLEGNGAIVACAWPEGAQTVSLLPESTGATRLFGAIKIALDGKEMYLEILAGPRIWWKESLQPAYLEKNVELDWKRPYPATYKTQLPLRAETTTLRTFLFQKKPNEQYRPEVGACAWPVWFEDERAFIRLGKKIPPGGEAILYPMDNGDKTLMGFVSRTPMAGLIAKQNERTELPRGPRNAANVGFVACGGTKVIRQTIFAMGLQNREKEFLSEYADFLADYVAIVQQRNVAAFRFVDETRGKLETWAKEPDDDPEARAYIAKMMEQAKVLEEGMRIKMELYGENTPEQHMARADRAAQRLKELLDTGDPEVYPECEELIDTCNVLAWGHAEVAGMRFSMLAREWAQQAALECAAVPKATQYAQAIRAAIRTTLNGSPPW
jgi:hypothetical protein